ncbi:hypothetical protein MPLA_1450004 [Mesorhizobium sp. ORS 3359]|nr:hypothetical protein MPLA_1450004 [Mesorhizobium sp. ORS 3359]
MKFRWQPGWEPTSSLAPCWLASFEASHFFAKPPRGLSSDDCTDLKRVAIPSDSLAPL